MMEINKIYQGDCLELMKQIEDKSIDLIIIDPPYNIKIAKWDILSSKEFLELCKKVIKESYRVLKENGSIYFYGTIKNIDFFKIPELFIQEKFIYKNCISIGHYSNFERNIKNWQNRKEELLFFVKSEEFTFNFQLDFPSESMLNRWGSYAIDGKIPYELLTPAQQNRFKKQKKPMGLTGGVAKNWWIINHICGGNKEKVNHPTQKRLMGCDRIILASSNKDDIILVPFAGSGSECISAYKNGRKFIGIELSPEYCEIANKRIEEALKSKKEVLLWTP